MYPLQMLAKCPLAKCPLTKCPLAKRPLAKCPLAICPGFVHRTLLVKGFYELNAIGWCFHAQFQMTWQSDRSKDHRQIASICGDKS